MATVLLIDDAPDMDVLVKLALKSLDVDVVQVAHLVTALETMNASPPDAILLDLSLDGEDGLGLLPVIKNDEALRAIPIIAFTVHGSKRSEALDAGADGFVEKPFKVAELLRIVKPFLGGEE